VSDSFKLLEILRHPVPHLVGSIRAQINIFQVTLTLRSKRAGDLLVQKLQEGLKLKVANVQGFDLILIYFCVCFKVDEQVYNCSKQCSRCRLHHGKNLIRGHLNKKSDIMMSGPHHIPSYGVKLGHGRQIFIFGNSRDLYPKEERNGLIF